ncbi:hypothetical protein [Moorena sp. SIO3B2]|uniref:hypothetical protein n=1 Tax=Moorena sp. SIO3B2 TaxID=2607827 RepID=UPI0013C6B84D|nr:hypothetical protein [Moorena sp. SIO3B2]NEP36058.1 hypothetical protein [Moorena sp. SIO3B2]
MAFNWPQPELTVRGKVGIGTETPSQELDVIGDISARNLTLNGSLTIDENLTVGGNFQLGTLSINAFSSDGNLADNSNLAVPTEQAVKTYVDGQISQVNNALDTKAALNGTASQDFATNNLTVGGNLRVSGNLEVQGNVIARDTEHIAGNVSLGDQDSDEVKITGVIRSGHSSGSLRIDDALHTTGSLTVDGSLSVRDAIATAQLSVTDRVSGSLTIDNDLTVNGAIATNQLSVTGSVTTPLTIDNTLTVNSAIATNQLSVGGSVTGSLTVDNNLTVNGAIATARLSVTEQVTGSLTIENNLTVGGLLTTSELNATGIIRSDVFRSSTNDWEIARNGEHLEIREPEEGAKVWARFNDDRSLHLIGTPNLWVDGRVGIGTTNPSQKLDVRGNVNINGNLNVTNNIAGGNLELRGGTNEIQFTRSILSNFLNSDSTNNLKLSLSKRQLVGEDAPTYQLWIGHPSQFRFGNQGAIFNTFSTKLSVRSNGDVNVAGRLSAQNLTIRSGDKSGYVSDRFVNAVGDPIEQGDVVVLSDHPVSRFYATQNDIPIPEVDLTNRAYDTRVCGIVAKVTTEEDLPYVDNEESPIPPEVLAQISPEDLQKQIPSEELPEEIAASLQTPHPFQSLVAKTEAGMNTAVVQDQQMGSMVTMGCFSYCKVDADIAPIAVGDLLTTSPTKGHGQKVLEPERAIGAIIGKALGSLSSGKVKIPVLVMLQ